MENENLYDLYENKLKEDTRPGLILAKFYSELFTIPLSKEVIITMNKLNRLYGRVNVFYSIIDIYNMENLDHKRIYGILNYHCNRHMHNKEDGYEALKLTLPPPPVDNLIIIDPFEEENA